MFKKLLKSTDYIVLACVFILFIIGVIAIFSAGYNSEINKTEYIKQLIWFGATIIVMIFVWAVDYSVFDIFGYIIFVVNLILLGVVLFMPSYMGAHSWFNLGGVLYQPSELMKLGYILCSAKFMTFLDENTMKNNKKKKWIIFGILFLLFVIPVILILLQPDFGTAVTFAVILIFMLFKSGIKYRYIFAGLALVIIMVPIVYFFLLNNVQKERIRVFLDPSLDPLGSGYNAIQSKIAVGSGKAFGTGLLQGSQTQNGYLPIKSSDFIFSVISEEMGFVISTLVVVIYTVLIIRLIIISKNAKDKFASLVVIGIAGMFFFHFAQNIGMTIGFLPITGVPLPFLSYGGSNLVTNGIAIAIALNISARKSKNLFLD